MLLIFQKVGYKSCCRGASSLPGLKHYGLHVDHIDAIVISHFHGDHYGGVPFLLLDAAIAGRTKKLQIFSYKRMFLTHFDQEMLDRLDQLKLGYLSDGMELMV